MQTRQNRIRRLSVQNLETRKLFAADVGFGEMTDVPVVPAEICAVRSGNVERPTSRLLNHGSPAFDVENQTQSTTTPERNSSTAKTDRYIEFTITIEPVNDAPGGIALFTEQIVGTADPGGEGTFTEQVAG